MFAMPGLALNVFAELSLSALAMGTEAHPPATKATTTMQNPAIFLNIDSSLCLKSIVFSCWDSIFYEEARVVKSSRGGRREQGGKPGGYTLSVYPIFSENCPESRSRRGSPCPGVRRPAGRASVSRETRSPWCRVPSVLRTVGLPWRRRKLPGPAEPLPSTPGSEICAYSSRSPFPVESSLDV